MVGAVVSVVAPPDTEMEIVWPVVPAGIVISKSFSPEDKLATVDVNEPAPEKAYETVTEVIVASVLFSAFAPVKYPQTFL